jgi:hypothetical protein
MRTLLLSIFNLEQIDQRLLNLSRQAYLAQEMRYNVTGKYTAFSEGGSDCGYFVWEWIIRGMGVCGLSRQATATT